MLARFFAKIVPSCAVEVVKQVFKGEDAEKLLLDGERVPDFVVDAIDNRQTKTELIQFCSSRGIKVVSSMGAGGRVDPSRVQMGRLSDTKDDPLCKANKKRQTVLIAFFLNQKAADDEACFASIRS